MANTAYLESIKLIPGDEWYVGLDVVIKANIGCFNIPCDECETTLRFGISNAKRCNCGATPDGFHSYGSRVVKAPCAGFKTYSFSHTVTRSDIELIESGVRRCCAYLRDGINGMCYEYDSVKIIDKPDIPSECSDGDKRSPEKCTDITIYHEVCENGRWVPSGEKCPIDPPGCFEGEIRDPIVCSDGSTIHRQICKNGNWISYQMCPDTPDPTPDPNPTPDPDSCDGVVCDDKCYGKDLYNRVCLNGTCIQDELVATNADKCVEEDKSKMMIYLLVGIGIIVIVYMMQRK